MMKSTPQPHELQHAWQTAFQLRTCPDTTTLMKRVPDENLLRHLAICSICREKRSMQAGQVDAWQKLFDMFVPLVPQTKYTPQSGQVWVLDKRLAGWGGDGYFYSPPNVLLLEKLDDKNGFRAVQIYFDERLMGEGDVWLGDQFGFAEAWNSYTLHQGALACWLGNATDSQIAEINHAVNLKYSPIEDHSTLYFFRKLEITVGSRVAMESVARLMEEMEFELSGNESFLQNIIGSLSEAYQKLSSYRLPEFATSLIDLLAGATDPHGISPVLAAASQLLPVNIVIKQQDGAITIKTTGAVLTDNMWEDGDFFVAGRLAEPLPEEYHLIASLRYKDETISECQSKTLEGSPYFDILFKKVPKDAAKIDNLKFILVRP